MTIRAALDRYRGGLWRTDRTAAALVLAALVLAAHVGFQSADVGVPAWLTVALSVLPFVGAGIGYTAQADAADYDPRHDKN